MGRVDIRKCRKSGNLDLYLKIGYMISLKLSCYNLKYVPASKAFDDA